VVFLSGVSNRPAVRERITAFAAALRGS